MDDGAMKTLIAHLAGSIAVAPAGGHEYAVVPDGFKFESLERVFDQPWRKRGDLRFELPDDFSRYVNLHKEPGTRIFADMGQGRICAVIDHHHAFAEWRGHRATLSPPQDPDWLDWRAADGKHMSQVDFAQFIEDHLPNILDPDGAELLEVAQHLEAKQAVTFKSAERLTDGARAFVFEETAQGRVGNGKIEVPATFELWLPVFRGNEERPMTARLRYRIRNGELVLWVHLDRPHEVLEGAIAAMGDQIEASTLIPVWRGADG